MVRMSSRLFGIVVAAGTGVRLGRRQPKALVQIEGRSILEHAISRLCGAVAFDQLVITYPEGFKDDYKSIVSSVREDAILIPGGETRQLSVKNALLALKDRSPNDSDLVLIHDAARCLVTTESIVAVIEKAKEVGAATLALPQLDSLKRVQSGTLKVKETLHREDLWRIQTPQVFEFHKILMAHESLEQATDDASLVERVSEVHLVSGDEQNFKVTTEWDLQLASFLVRKPSA